MYFLTMVLHYSTRPSYLFSSLTEYLFFTLVPFAAFLLILNICVYYLFSENLRSVFHSSTFYLFEKQCYTSLFSFPSSMFPLRYQKRTFRTIERDYFVLLRKFLLELTLQPNLPFSSPLIFVIILFIAVFRRTDPRILFSPVFSPSTSSP